MNSIFAAQGFQRSNTFMGSPLRLRGASLGRGLTASEIDSYTAKITDGRAKLAKINAWLDAKRAAQPFGWTAFNDEVSNRNFFGWMDTIGADQYGADNTWAMIQNPSSGDYDIPDDYLWRTDEWAMVINTAYNAMIQSGGAVPTTSPASRPAGAAAVMPPYNPLSPTGGKVPSTYPGAYPPGMTAPKSTGISTQDILVGGGIALGVGALLYALA
jgi:hypothetical protein